MRPSEHVSRSELGGPERGLRETEGRAQSPSPSYTGSYGYGDDDDDEAEDEEYALESDRGSAAERFGLEPTPASASAVPAPQQKPKRTRQLTTPQQAAVLHALLAQSRFPTTAMREEVGRQIGLSARKVQVWFQNQRQKARKESKEAAAQAAAGAAPRESRPPQFSSFPNAPPGGIGAPSQAFPEPTSAAGPRTSIRRPEAPPSRRASEPSFDIRPTSSVVSIRRSSGDDLTGPGVPGAGVAIEPFPQPSCLPSASSTQLNRPLSPQQGLRLPPVHTITPPLPPIGRREGHAAVPAIHQTERIEEHPSPRSLRLPPIQLGPHNGRHRSFEQGSDVIQMASGRSHIPISSRAAYSSPSAYHPPRTAGVGPTFSLGRAETPPVSMAPRHIPPPFTLEPNPEWQPSSSAAFAARTRTQSGPVTYATPSSGPSRQRPTGDETSMIESRMRSTPARTTRFDPVRNTEVPPPSQHTRPSSLSFLSFGVPTFRLRKLI
ncbi:uncharacterized protein FOMMEDRAFT_148693 [Fomitiporia mediterranea MF3/22]|uniref:uncharacterized protein n=1 Tax=Fomitiporia mediterranea (strain MF3/22) TaxID=694068 RepID=UPI0004409C43|nr:uncharacterized protein FOMMEDRAFT_148693 [Fomitiporia mediterranea MF3/22]EJC99520.1 hypothetical protein FOMMEDRAFT_148693 [Fomitiporia mediterranea MF3/22]